MPLTMRALHSPLQLDPTWFGQLAPLLHANGYHPLPIPPKGKRASLKGWQRFCHERPTNSQIARWCETFPRHSLALACGSIVAVDVDEDDVARADACEALVRAYLGGQPLVRTGRAPRRVLLYRAARGATITTRRLGTVEILGRGAYVLAYGIHPVTCQPYHWRDVSPADCRWDALPECSPAALDALANALKEETRTKAREGASGPIGFHGPLAIAPVSSPARVRPDPRWVIDANGRVIDGRDAFLASAVFRAYASGLADAEEIANAAYERFKAGADLTRGKRDGARAWSRLDALSKARALLASGKARPARRLSPNGSTGFWTPATRHAFARLTDAAGAAGHLSPAAVAVSGIMLAHVEGDGSAFLAVATIAQRLGLAPDTVKRARRHLVTQGYWTAERVKGGRGHLAHYRPSAAVMAREEPSRSDEGWPSRPPE